VTTINILSVRLAARTQVLFSVIKVGGLLVIIGGGIYQIAIGMFISFFLNSCLSNFSTIQRLSPLNYQ
jgi:L-asparagine transporter-like permease